MFEEIKSKDHAVKLGGDARCCSPGHTAKFGSYSVMDLSTSKVLDIQLVQVLQICIKVINPEIICILIAMKSNLSLVQFTIPSCSQVLHVLISDFYSEQ